MSPHSPSLETVLAAEPAHRTNRRAAPQAQAARICRGDSFDALAVLGENTVDVLITSPPYWGQRDYGLTAKDGVLDEWQREANNPIQPPGYAWYRSHGGVLGLEPYPEWYVSHLVEFFTLARRVVKPAGSVWVNLGDTYFARWSSMRGRGRQGLGEQERRRRRTPSGGWRHDKQLLMVPARFAIAMQETGWILRNDLIWSKPNPMPSSGRDRLRLSHEHFFHFVQRTPGGRPRYYYDMAGVEDGSMDVVRVVPANDASGHSATFPRVLVAPRIASSSPRGGVVLDPFCGSGTALAVALESGRSAIGIELSREYAALAARRLRKEFECCAGLRPVGMSGLQRHAS